MSYNEWLDIDVLEDYLDGKLDAKTMHRVEKISLEDPFVAEALAGLSQSPKRAHSLSLLQKQLQERIAQKPIEQKRWRITSQRLSIAAAAAVLFVTVSVLFWMKENNRRQLLIANQAKKVEVVVAPETAKTIQPATKKPALKIEIDQAVAVTKPKNNVSASNPKPIKDNFGTAVAVRSAEKTIAMAAPVALKANKVTTDSMVTIAAIQKEQENKSLTQALTGRVAGINPAVNRLSGIVISKIDGLPISGANVKLINSYLRTTTDAKGEFSFSVDDLGNQRIAIGALGFATKEIKAKPNQAFKIEMEPNQQMLSEVAIVTAKQNRASASAIVKATPMPEGGWDSFEQYLKLNNSVLKEAASTKQVILSFNILSNGRPANIKIITKSTIEAENQEAIRLINDGPNWILPKNAVPLTTVNIKF